MTSTSTTRPARRDRPKRRWTTTPTPLGVRVQGPGDDLGPGVDQVAIDAPDAETAREIYRDLRSLSLGGFAHPLPPAPDEGVTLDELRREAARTRRR